MSQQNKPVVPVKKIVWMKCRANGEGCGGNHAYATLIFAKPMIQGGGRTVRYRCTSCDGMFQITT
jgi:hypothetical protein